MAGGLNERAIVCKSGSSLSAIADRLTGRPFERRREKGEERKRVARALHRVARESKVCKERSTLRRPAGIRSS